MARHIPELLEEITSVITLEPGDIVATGTHHEALSPIQDGFKVRLEDRGIRSSPGGQCPRFAKEALVK